MSSPATAAATAHFVEKWWRREPEMRIAAVFSARADAGADARADAELRFSSWGALLHELREALFELSDPGVGAAKRGWWAEELQLISQARPRHPLGEALASLPDAQAAPWTGLALAVAGGAVDERSADTAQALAALRPLAQSTLAVENALFRVRDAGEGVADALAVHWLLHRLPAGLAEEDGARVPMHLLARHGLTATQLGEAPGALLRDWAGELLQALPERGQGAFLRRARQRFDAARLRKLAGGDAGPTDHEPAQLATLWRAWRAARGP
jgi:hypothetical protein